MPRITGLQKNGVLRKNGFAVGDEITAFDGYGYVDYLDYLFFDSKQKFDITFLRDGEVMTKRISKRDGQSMGAELDDGDIEPRVCRNKCIFCFVDQMKKGMRDTLYVKDDDYRLSFIGGNYITLTNLSPSDVDRIKRLGLSPLYVSVHAYDKAVRQKMLGNRFAGRLFDTLKDLGKSGIKFHTQIVLVEGVNDGAVLAETVNELYSLGCVSSAAIVPVGLTKFRDGLTDIKPLSLSCLNETIDFAEGFAQKSLKERGEAFVFCGDEMYIKAKRTLPSFEYYGDFCQIENGVGLVAAFVTEAKAYEPAEGRLEGVGPRAINIETVTGESFYETMVALAKYFESRLSGLKIKVRLVKNEFFGENVTVAGLITGDDIAKQVRPDDDCDLVMLPRVMLRQFDDVFLDGMTVAELSSKLKKDIVVAPSDGYEFAEMLYELYAES
ncbi:MAG: DUF512 domain-containing protein [Clostridiales bacterium]|jgi:putative radical SAM enzyme (TIGR03279 family)|nr:DUF512 domain-containing protein [Clostridiales bacterium]